MSENLSSEFLPRTPVKSKDYEFLIFLSEERGFLTFLPHKNFIYCFQYQTAQAEKEKQLKRAEFLTSW